MLLCNIFRNIIVVELKQIKNQFEIQWTRQVDIIVLSSFFLNSHISLELYLRNLNTMVNFKHRKYKKMVSFNITEHISPLAATADHLSPIYSYKYNQKS